MLYDVAARDGYDPEIGMLVAMLEDGTREWREELEEVADEVVWWQPFEGSHSIGAVILHMIEAEAWWFETVGSGRELAEEELTELMSKETQQYSVSWPTPPAKPLSYFFDLHDRYRARTLETLRKFEAARQVQTGGASLDTFTLRWIVNHVVTH